MAGYRIDPNQLINGALFEVDYDAMVIVNDIEFYSMCEHHILPFFGHAHVAYIPNGKVIGLSKIPRIVEMFARRLQVQERMTQQIANFIQDAIMPEKGVVVVLEAQHLCMMMRGVRKKEASMTTSAMLGVPFQAGNPHGVPQSYRFKSLKRKLQRPRSISTPTLSVPFDKALFFNTYSYSIEGILFQKHLRQTSARLSTR